MPDREIEYQSYKFKITESGDKPGYFWVLFKTPGGTGAGVWDYAILVEPCKIETEEALHKVLDRMIPRIRLFLADTPENQQKYLNKLGVSIVMPCKK
jgi:hypothetical protein